MFEQLRPELFHNAGQLHRVLNRWARQRKKDVQKVALHGIHDLHIGAAADRALCIMSLLTARSSQSTGVYCQGSHLQGSKLCMV